MKKKLMAEIILFVVVTITQIDQSQSWLQIFAIAPLSTEHGRHSHYVITPSSPVIPPVFGQLSPEDTWTDCFESHPKVPVTASQRRRANWTTRPACNPVSATLEIGKNVRHAVIGWQITDIGDRIESFRCHWCGESMQLSELIAKFNRYLSLECYTILLNVMLLANDLLTWS